MPEWIPNANPADLIDWFDDFDGPNTFRYLSNFFIGEPIIMQRNEHLMPFAGPHVAYMTGEHAYQAQKAATQEQHDYVNAALTPGESKKRGNKIKLRPDWEDIKRSVMYRVVGAKFKPGRLEAQLLMDTGDARLVEGTWWNDREWGVDLNTPSPSPSQHPLGFPGNNWLGLILMERREDLRTHATR